MDLLTLAKNVAQRVEAQATQVKVPVAVCVVDVHGNVVLQHRMPGAPLFSLELSERKAYTSALVRLRTADLVPLVQPGQPLYPLIMVSGGRYSAMGGGVPLASEGEVVAGVGVSGGTTTAARAPHNVNSSAAARASRSRRYQRNIRICGVLSARAMCAMPSRGSAFPTWCRSSASTLRHASGGWPAARPIRSPSAF